MASSLFSCSNYIMKEPGIACASCSTRCTLPGSGRVSRSGVVASVGRADRSRCVSAIVAEVCGLGGDDLGYNQDHLVGDGASLGQVLSIPGAVPSWGDFCFGVNPRPSRN